MDSFKTYETVDRSDTSVSIGISRMEDIHDRRKGTIDEPHRHNFYTVLVIKDGNGLHKIDFSDYALAPNQLFFISPGQVHQLQESKQSLGYSLVFSPHFLLQNNIPEQFIEDLNLFHDFGETPPLTPQETDFQYIISLCEEMINVSSKQSQLKNETLGALLKLLLIRCTLSCTNPIDYSDGHDTANTTLRAFKQLIDQHYHEWHGTSEYADALNISSDYLNRIVKPLTGKTAKEHIQSRITTAAKRMIFFSDLSNKEIAYELGFSEPANFSAFFKKCVGQSPSDFKLSQKK